MQEWLLNLCFTAELTQIRDVEGKAPSTVEVALIVRTEKLGDVVEQSFDENTLRMRNLSLLPGRSRCTPKFHRNIRGDADVWADLWKQPGLDKIHAMLKDHEGDPQIEHLIAKYTDFIAYQRYVFPFHGRAQYLRCTSVGDFGEAVEVYLYIPGLDAMPLKLSPPEARLPTVPTLYKSADEAAYPLTVQYLWAGDEVLRDYAVGLAGNGLAGLSAARVQHASYRDGSVRTFKFVLPHLRGTLKQVAWASEIRQGTVTTLGLARAAFGRKMLMRPADAPTEYNAEAAFEDACECLA